MKQFSIVIFVLLVFCKALFFNVLADVANGKITGKIVDNVTKEGLIGANVLLIGSRLGAVSDSLGVFQIEEVPGGTYSLQGQYIGYQTKEIIIKVTAGETTNATLQLASKAISVDKVVVTATKNEQNRSEAPVIVNILDEFVFDNTQSLSLAEGLGFQPGVRVEVDCQTCNYTQIRMNGLGGSYSQVLIDSRPVFSSLNGLYGLDYIPTNMIERVETIRGGGSALYGSSAIGGVVNILTREPEANQIQVTANGAQINQQTPDRAITLNTAVLNGTRDVGAHFFGMMRRRGGYDHNGDGFTEISRMDVNSFGMRSFYKPGAFSKFTLEGHAITEERQGGDNINSPPHEANQSEYRDHKVYGGSLSYEQFFTADLNKLSAYASGQYTDRVHYTGLDMDPDAYGTSENLTAVGGLQYTHNLNNFAGNTTNVITMGAEGVYDDIDDRIPGFNVFTDQITRQLGIYLQSDWQMHKRFSALLGARLDYHNLVDNPIFNPRATLLYSLTDKLQWRGSVSTGFRAPQAFDADLHIAFAGGGISRIVISDDLVKETSLSYSTSLDFNTATEHYSYGMTLEGFYTRLFDAFVLEEAETDSDGNLILERRNGGNSTVAGASVEFRVNYDNTIQLGANFTVQRSEYDDPVMWSADLPPTTNYLRTPNFYGSYALDYLVTKPLTLSFSGVITGPMDILHVAGYIEEDTYERSPTFWEANIKANYDFGLNGATVISVFAGVQNIFNQYQDDFDKGKDRDSNYVYGPARPLTIYSGLKISL